MTIFDVLTAPWAIEPAKLVELHAIYNTHASGGHVDIEAVEKRLGRPLANEQKDYEIKDGVAVLNINGVIAKKMNMFSQISGGASSQFAIRAINAAVRDDAVHSILLCFDSPGGTVDGTELFANTIKAARAQKTIVSLGSGTMASAAYWSGSAAQSVYIVDGTTAVGSIGVVAAHKDVSGAEAARGIKTTELSAGRYKRVASQFGPLSEEGRQSIQDQLDYMYSLFVGAVADHRGVTPDSVIADMADGRIFTGQQAVQAGLVDGIMTFDAMIEKLNSDRKASSARIVVPGRSGTATSPSTNKGNPMSTVEEIKASHPDVAEAIRAEGVAAGAAAERARIQAVEGQLITGHEALITKMKFDGTSTAGDAAMAVLAAEKKGRDAHAKASDAEAPKPVPQTPSAAVPAADAPEQELSRAELDKRAKEHMASHPGVSYVAAYKAVGGK